MVSGENQGEQDAVKPREQEAKIALPLPREQTAKILPLLPREQKAVTAAKPRVTKSRSLGSKTPKSTAKIGGDFIKNLLPPAPPGWWDVEANGKGFLPRFRWREEGEQPAQPTVNFPRISREQAETLKGSNYAKQLMEDRIYGHLDDLNRDPKRRERARRIAAWLGVALRDYSHTQSENSKIRRLR